MWLKFNSLKENKHITFTWLQRLNFYHQVIYNFSWTDSQLTVVNPGGPVLYQLQRGHIYKLYLGYERALNNLSMTITFQNNELTMCLLIFLFMHELTALKTNLNPLK